MIIHVEFHAIQYGSVDKNVFIPFNWTYRGTDYYVCFIKKEEEIKKNQDICAGCNCLKNKLLILPIIRVA